MKLCKDCGCDVPNAKRWGYVNLCDECDVPERSSKHRGVMIADGKTDYGIQLVRNPTDAQASKIESLGKAHDPRTQMRFTGKGQHTDKGK